MAGAGHVALAVLESIAAEAGEGGEVKEVEVGREQQLSTTTTALQLPLFTCYPLRDQHSQLTRMAALLRTCFPCLPFSRSPSTSHQVRPLILPSPPSPPRCADPYTLQDDEQRPLLNPDILPQSVSSSPPPSPPSYLPLTPLPLFPPLPSFFSSCSLAAELRQEPTPSAPPRISSGSKKR